MILLPILKKSRSAAEICLWNTYQLNNNTLFSKKNVVETTFLLLQFFSNMQQLHPFFIFISWCVIVYSGKVRVIRHSFFNCQFSYIDIDPNQMKMLKYYFWTACATTQDHFSWSRSISLQLFIFYTFNLDLSPQNVYFSLTQPIFFPVNRAHTRTYNVLTHKKGRNCFGHLKAKVVFMDGKVSADTFVKSYGKVFFSTFRLCFALCHFQFISTQIKVKRLFCNSYLYYQKIEG